MKDACLKHGIAATWNDNNEFEICRRTRSPRLRQTYPAHEAKVLQTHLMMRASRDAQSAHRARHAAHSSYRARAASGMQRYAQTWSGDNYTRGKRCDTT